MEITTLCDLYAHCERSVAIPFKDATHWDCFTLPGFAMTGEPYLVYGLRLTTFSFEFLDFSNKEE